MVYSEYSNPKLFLLRLKNHLVCLIICENLPQNRDKLCNLWRQFFLTDYYLFPAPDLFNQFCINRIKTISEI